MSSDDDEANVVTTGVNFNRYLQWMLVLIVEFGRTAVFLTISHAKPIYLRRGGRQIPSGFPALEKDCKMQFHSTSQPTFMLRYHVIGDQGELMPDGVKRNLGLSGLYVLCLYNYEKDMTDSFIKDGWSRPATKVTFTLFIPSSSVAISDSLIINSVKYFSQVVISSENNRYNISYLSYRLYIWYSRDEQKS